MDQKKNEEEKELPESVFVPRNLYLRLSRRHSAQYFIGYCFTCNDYFWNFVFEFCLLNKELYYQW